jgi:hypothetical protein
MAVGQVFAAQAGEERRDLRMGVGVGEDVDLRRQPGRWVMVGGS